MANKNVTISPSLDISGLVIEEVQKTIDKNKEQAYRNLVDNIKKDTNQFVPYKYGNLELCKLCFQSNSTIRYA